jgi:hypothetical protein
MFLSYDGADNNIATESGRADQFASALVYNDRVYVKGRPQVLGEVIRILRRTPVRVARPSSQYHSLLPIETSCYPTEIKTPIDFHRESAAEEA